MPPASTRRWRPRQPLAGVPTGADRWRCHRWCPDGRGRSGSGRSPRPPLRGDRGAVQSTARPVDGVRPTQPIEQHPMQARPNAGVLPVAQPAPAGHAGPAAHLTRQHLPGDAGPQHEQDAAERGAVGHPRPAAPGAWRGWRQQGRDLGPQRLGNERSGHAQPTPTTRMPFPVLIGALIVGELIGRLVKPNPWNVSTSRSSHLTYPRPTAPRCDWYIAHLVLEACTDLASEMIWSTKFRGSLSPTTAANASGLKHAAPLRNRMSAFTSPSSPTS